MNEEKQVKDVIPSLGFNVSLFQGVKTGFENTDQDTFKTPFLCVLNNGCAELKKKESTYVKGAEEGMFYNKATGKLYNEIDVIVVQILHNLVAWKPNRGGFAGAYDKTEREKIVTKKDGMKQYDREGNIICDTITFFCLDANKPGLSNMFALPLSNTAFKHAKDFATKIRLLEVDGVALGVSFAGVWTLKTTIETNEFGQWYTVGKTPQFKRFITKDEFENYVKPAISVLEKAETDFSQMDTGDTTATVVDTKESQY
jgi:hypothetical protein